jgi:hypothetical protein
LNPAEQNLPPGGEQCDKRKPQHERQGSGAPEMNDDEPDESELKSVE